MHARPAHYPLSYQIVYLFFFFFRLAFCFGDCLPIYIQTSWNSLCRIGWLWTHLRSTCLLQFPRVELTKGLDYHAQNEVFNFLSINRQTVSMGKSNYLYWQKRQMTFNTCPFPFQCSQSQAHQGPSNTTQKLHWPKGQLRSRMSEDGELRSAGGEKDHP